MATKTKEQSVEITIPPIKINELRLTIIGDSPMICHAWSEKAKREMLDKQMKKAKGGKEAKDPFKDFTESLYWMSEKPHNPTMEALREARFGFPSVAFKSAAVDACSYADGITKVMARGAFHISGDMVEIQGIPEMREDMVRIGMGTADIRYRGEFRSWKVDLDIRYNAAALSAEQIVNLFNIGGFAVGIGEWRPQKDGSFGMFHVV
ncbi:conserved hypothetical protein [Candidatus Desulfosporosinus infrequens]|uniref:Uncharacterized protein n=1 Tax=Candidatus Desulfosporosinus infrequens TaxID=2043169 RepID=A0A2U3LKS7_9FIRM|nr:conserved hypothetical protein [Candidatus Desulfosporosinus infrequens]